MLQKLKFRFYNQSKDSYRELTERTDLCFILAYNPVLINVFEHRFAARAVSRLYKFTYVNNRDIAWRPTRQEIELQARNINDTQSLLGCR